MEQKIYIARDSQDKILGVYASRELAERSWRLSYSKLFVPTFTSNGESTTVVSATNEPLGSIDCWPVYTSVEHL